MTAADVLRNGKAYLQQQGWYQGNYSSPCTSAVCMLGACMQFGSEHAVIPFFRQATGYEGEYFHKWNDAPGRTVEEVYAAFDKAIEIAEGQR